MLAMAGDESIERVYFELSRHPEWLWPEDPEGRIPEGLAAELYALSEDVVTTVWLLIVWQEEFVAQDFVRDVDVSSVIEDFRSHAGGDEGARKLLAEEVDGLIESARMFGERISNMIDNGVIVGNEPVKRYLQEKLENMLEAWLQYRLKLQAGIGAW